MLNGHNDLKAAKALEEALWATDIAYGDPPRLWRVSPQWYYLWPVQWERIFAFGSLLPHLRLALDGDSSATYLRADFTLDVKGNVILLELNDTPVWDFGTQAVREIYHTILGSPERAQDPFPGAARSIAKMLIRNFPGRRVAILLSPDRLSYRAEYGCLAAYFGSVGIEAIVSASGEHLKDGDVVYRTFSRNWLVEGAEFPGVKKLLSLMDSGKVCTWPPFTKLEDKVWMTYPFNDASANGSSNAFNREPLQKLREFIPQTWPVDPSKRGLPWGKRLLCWHSNELTGDLMYCRPGSKDQPYQLKWVLKRALGAQGRGTAFSSWVGPEEWRGRLIEALLSVNGQGPHYVIQEEVKTLRHKASYLNHSGNFMADATDLRVRLCVSYLIEGDRVEIIDSDATLLDRPLVHGSSDAIALPVVVRVRK